ncbi:MAG: sugar ABC transporter permease [Spirochaetaceae bacterium]|jgi:raffinose/stachyose/melibiose transport system permease protein|nr:sugar ABC transporter permease [Spirochaetaceae bacterium]
MGILKDKKAYFTFLLPALSFYLFAVFYPIIQSVGLSLVRWNGIGKWQFAGLSNYISIFKDRIFYTALVNNLIYLIIVVCMQIVLGMSFAILMTHIKNPALIKTFYYIPCIITTVAIAQLFRSIYATEPLGLLNQCLQAVGLKNMATTWLTNTKTVLAAVSVPEGWRFTGLYMVIYYVALVSLDTEVLEAAQIDGADGWVLLFRIKFPMIRPVILLSLTMCLTGALRGFDIPFLLTNGGPGNISELLSTYMYKKAFGSNQYGYGSAIAVFIILESIGVITCLNIFSKTQEGEK